MLNLNIAALKAVILDSQQHGQKFRVFASVQCRQVSPVISHFFEASVLLTLDGKKANRQSGSPEQGQNNA